MRNESLQPKLQVVTTLVERYLLVQRVLITQMTLAKQAKRKQGRPLTRQVPPKLAEMMKNPPERLVRLESEAQGGVEAADSAVELMSG